MKKYKVIYADPPWNESGGARLNVAQMRTMT